MLFIFWAFVCSFDFFQPRKHSLLLIILLKTCTMTKLHNHYSTANKPLFWWLFFKKKKKLDYPYFVPWISLKLLQGWSCVRKTIAPPQERWCQTFLGCWYNLDLDIENRQKMHSVNTNCICQHPFTQIHCISKHSLKIRALEFKILFFTFQDVFTCV